MTTASTTAIATTATTTAAATTTTNQSKRKRDISLQELQQYSTIPKSASTITMLQPSLKKLDKKRTTKTIPLKKMKHTIIQQNYRRPIYLKRSSATLFQMLSKTLNYTFKEKPEQKYIYLRLNLFDQQYCLKVDEQLWQSYLDIGLQQHVWPDQLHKTAKTDDFQLCHEYLKNYIEIIKEQLNQCEIKLLEQSQRYSITKFSIDQMDHCLKEYVDCQRKYLAMRNKQQLVKFKNNIQEKDLSKAASSTDITTTNNQEIVRQLVSIRKEQVELWKEFLMLKMRILFKFLPPNFDYLQQFISPIHYSPLNNDRKTIELRNKHDKYIREAKRTWLNIYFNAYITKIQVYDRQYQNCFTQLESQIKNSSGSVNTDNVKKVKDYMIDQTNKLKDNISKQISTFCKKLLQDRQNLSSSMQNIISASPEPYLNLITNHFDKRQWNYLSYGPSMIRSNQSVTRPREQQEKEIVNLHKEIYNKVEYYLIAHNMPKTHPNLRKYSDNLLNYLNQCYFIPLPYKEQIEADEQAHIVASIRKLIQKHKLIIRVTDKGNNFYIGLASDLEEKAQNYFIDTNAFIQLSNNPLDEILDKVKNLLRQLATDKLITETQCKKMLPDENKTELSHLYFNPKTHKENIPVRPIENTIHSATKNISDFLDQSIRPIFDSECKETTIIDGTSLIKELTKYSKKGLLKASTLFCTFDIRNLFTMLPQDEALKILVKFLDESGHTKVDKIRFTTIKQLASIVLEENVFVYGNKIYRQTLGGAMGSSFTLTLANIFMWNWQQKFVNEQSQSKEFFGRYVDDIVITWNRSEQELINFLNEANNWHPNIKLDYKIGKSLPFLDVLVTNNNGILETSVYHKPAGEPYVVPFISDHPRHVFGNIIQTALARAVRYSSTFQAFKKEQRYIELMLLFNG
ncbi:unnamed protein product [Rotaria sordida]|uniref:Reverse transcriptase domain-containing protein n=1 Tax=Rotaria sordida TaxID=392033 RepID=A0A814SWN6_9BILA|nr:unnamed protein product [Rotaria sordida]CAF1394997.1 unnamed protein product [Rotaria sordida]